MRSAKLGLVMPHAAILIMAASIRAGQSWDLRLPYASLRVTLRVGTQKQPTFMHLLTGLRLQHPPKRQQFSFWGRCRINAAFRQVWERRIYAAARRQSENCRAPKAKMRIAEQTTSAIDGSSLHLQYESVKSSSNHSGLVAVLVASLLVITGCQCPRLQSTSAQVPSPSGVMSPTTRELQATMTPQQALAELRAGNERFVSAHPRSEE